MTRFKSFFSLFLPVLMLMSLLAGNAQAALLDFGPIVPEVVGSTPPNVGHGFPAWFRDTNRVPLKLCVQETPGCLFAAANRPDLTKPLAFPNLPDELFYYSASATIGSQLLFAGVEMNFFDNGDGTYEQIGFARVRIRINSNVPGNYKVTTPWKQYFFTVDQATITANAGIRVINATEDIGLGPDGVFTGVLLGSIDTFVYSQGAPFVTAAGAFLGTGAALPVEGSKFTDPVTGQPANIFRIEGPPGFTTVSTNQFAVTGKINTDTISIPTPLTVDKLTYSRDAAGVQINAFATTQPLSNNRNTTALFPLNFALTGVPSALQVSGTGLPTQAMATNDPADGKFFSTSASFAFQGNLPDEASVTNVADTPVTSITVPLGDQVVIDNATYNPRNQILSITAVSSDRVGNPVLQAFITGTDVLLGTLANGQLNVGPFPITIGPVTYNFPPLNITVKSAKLGSETAPVSVVIPAAPAPIANNDTATAAAGIQVVINVLANDTSAGSTINPASITVSAATGGFAAANLDGTITYTAPGAPGTYTFTYTVMNNFATSETSNPATVTVTVNPPAAIISPVNDSKLAAASETFTWSNSGASNYQVWVGTTPGAKNIRVVHSTGTTATVTGLPVNGLPIYIRLYSRFGTTWSFSDYTYTAAGTPVAAAMITPVNAATLSGASRLFTWNNAGASNYQVWVGTTPGANNISLAHSIGATATVTGLPANGTPVFVRLYSRFGTTWEFNDYTYISGP